MCCVCVYIYIYIYIYIFMCVYVQGRTDPLETGALPEGPGSVGGPMRCPWYLFS
ncbi:unnamed protein product [Staurois parvus]|uniref:Uncharacterized protein n=1 Tax=Staurois parvus TaxID=386267 RepID=A0ABN9CBN0_9NEOB|nr:unnamed protein product [Staurois parvus]